MPGQFSWAIGMFKRHCGRVLCPAGLLSPAEEVEEAVFVGLEQAEAVKFLLECEGL